MNWTFRYYGIKNAIVPKAKVHGRKERKFMEQKRQSLTISLYPRHFAVLQRWERESGVGVSTLVRYAIEELSDRKFRWQGPLPVFELPKFRRETSE